jgi:putative transposase
VASGTIANILREHGIEPAPERDRHARWSTFLKAHWECLTATDCLSLEVYTLKGLVTYYILFFVDIASRSVHIAGVTPHRDNRWMTQIARNVMDVEEGFLRGARYLILDRDTRDIVARWLASVRARLNASVRYGCPSSFGRLSGAGEQ